MADVVEGRLGQTVENWSLVLRATAQSRNRRRRRIRVRSRWDNSGTVPRTECSGEGMVQQSSSESHGVAVLMPGPEDGGPRGALPGAKTSTMIMRPPQQGQGGR